MEHRIVYQGTQSHMTSHPVGQKHDRNTVNKPICGCLGA